MTDPLPISVASRSGITRRIIIVDKDVVQCTTYKPEMKKRTGLLLAMLSLVVAVTCSGPASAQTATTEPNSAVRGGFRWKRTPVEFKDGPAILKGTIFIPDGEADVPGIVILGGSERGPRARMKERLAEHFAGAGIAALIYDSAGTGQSTGNAMLQTRDARAVEAIAALPAKRDQDTSG